MVSLVACATPHAAKKNERYYQTIWCDQRGGEIEYVLDDRTRVDCLLPDYAVEVDWAHKWAEGVGQAQYYAIKTDRKPGLLLIIDDKGMKYVRRAEAAGSYSSLKVWVIKK